jgi:hypothetical protein
MILLARAPAPPTLPNLPGNPQLPDFRPGGQADETAQLQPFPTAPPSLTTVTPGTGISGWGAEARSLLDTFSLVTIALVLIAIGLYGVIK